MSYNFTNSRKSIRSIVISPNIGKYGMNIIGTRHHVLEVLEYLILGENMNMLQPFFDSEEKLFADVDKWDHTQIVGIFSSHCFEKYHFFSMKISNLDHSFWFHKPSKQWHILWCQRLPRNQNLYDIYSTGSPHFTRFHFARGWCFCQMNSHYLMHYTISSLYPVKTIIWVLRYILYFTLHKFHFTRVILKKQKLCKVRATCIIPQTRTLGGSSIWIGAKFALGKWLGRYVAIHNKFGLQTCWRLQLFWILGFESGQAQAKFA